MAQRLPLEPQPVRRKLPDERQSITHRFDIEGHEGYITIGLYDDGQPGEMFLTMAKEGSTISGFADAFAQATSYALQYGAPLESFVEKFKGVKFMPYGKTKYPGIPQTTSVPDYIARWLEIKFLQHTSEEAVHPTENLLPFPGPAPSQLPDEEIEVILALEAAPAANCPACHNCGIITVVSAGHYKCPNCGTLKSIF